jgi:subtilase family serine protease
LTCVRSGPASGGTIELPRDASAQVSAAGFTIRAAPEKRLDLKAVFALRNRASLERLLRDQQDPNSLEYHRWLTPAEFAVRFGPSEADFQAVAEWLKSEGFEVVSSDIKARYIRFAGAVSQAESTFGVEILASDDGRMFGNRRPPLIPTRFDGVIAHVEGLDNLRRFTSLAHRSEGPGRSPEVRIKGQGRAFGPADFYTFYDEKPILKAGMNGAGQDCIAFAEDSDYLDAAVDLFDSTFSVDSALISRSFPTTNPGTNSDESETLSDIEWAHVVAPGAPLKVYTGNDSNAIIDPITDAIQQAVTNNSCSVITVSFEFCGAPTHFYTDTLSPILEQAAAQGQSVFVASGDQGAAGLMLDTNKGKCVTGTSRHVNELAASPDVTACVGSQFSPKYDSSGNDKGFVPEQVWDEQFGSGFHGASGGGASAVFLKPAYQNGVTPGDNARDIPDVSIIASSDLPGVFLGDDNSGVSTIDCCWGGTSLSAPIWAGIARLIEQVKGERLGNINPRLYQLGPFENSLNLGLRDITMGSNSFNQVKGFAAGKKYDLASGWGSADVTVFANAFSSAILPTPTPTPTPTGTPTPTRTPRHTPKRTPKPTPTPIRSRTATPTPSKLSGPRRVSDSVGSADASLLIQQARDRLDRREASDEVDRFAHVLYHLHEDFTSAAANEPYVVRAGREDFLYSSEHAAVD